MPIRNPGEGGGVPIWQPNVSGGHATGGKSGFSRET